MKRACLPWLILLAPLLACATEDTASTDGSPPIVIISIDTLRSDRLPVYGYGEVETPAIDALAQDSILFERAYTHVPLTLPAHASLFTGLLPGEHGVRDNAGYRLDTEGRPYLPRQLSELGYRTGGAVSSFVLRSATGLGRHFDVYDDRIISPGSELEAERDGASTLDSIRPWVRSASEQPFLLFLHLYEPHTPYRPPEPYASRYSSAYDGEIAAADRVVGDLIDELRKLGVYDRAAIVLLSDHGEGLGDHGEQEHGVLLYREVLQIPLLLKLPRSERAGTSIATPVALIDVAPTLLELAGGDPRAFTARPVPARRRRWHAATTDLLGDLLSAPALRLERAELDHRRPAALDRWTCTAAVRSRRRPG